MCVVKLGKQTLCVCIFLKEKTIVGIIRNIKNLLSLVCVFDQNFLYGFCLFECRSIAGRIVREVQNNSNLISLCTLNSTVQTLNIEASGTVIVVKEYLFSLSLLSDYQIIVLPVHGRKDHRLIFLNKKREDKRQSICKTITYHRNRKRSIFQIRILQAHLFQPLLPQGQDSTHWSIRENLRDLHGRCKLVLHGWNMHGRAILKGYSYCGVEPLCLLFCLCTLDNYSFRNIHSLSII